MPIFLTSAAYEVNENEMINFCVSEERRGCKVSLGSAKEMIDN